MFCFGVDLGGRSERFRVFRLRVVYELICML